MGLLARERIAVEFDDSSVMQTPSEGAFPTVVSC